MLITENLAGQLLHYKDDNMFINLKHFNMALIIEANNQKQNHQTTPASQINTKYRNKKNKNFKSNFKLIII